MADPDLNDLAVFVRVVERGGFAKAARELGVPTSTVSRTVARVESLVGARLLHRTTRAVRPTSDGRELFESVADAVATLQQAARGLEPKGRTPKGLLRVTAPNDIGSTFLADIVVEFTAKYADVDVELVLTNRTVNLIEEGFDVAIRAGRLVDSSLVARKAGELETVLYASPRYLERRGAPKSLDELKTHSLVVFRSKENVVRWALVSKRGGDEPIEVRGRIGGDDFTFVRATLLAGGGIGLLPQIVAAQDEALGHLVRVLPDYEMRTGALYVVYPSARHVPPRVSVFRDYVVDAFAERVAMCKKGHSKRAAARGK